MAPARFRVLPGPFRRHRPQTGRDEAHFPPGAPLAAPGERVTAAAIAFLVSAAVVAAIARWPGVAPQDRPNERSLHERAVPRAGGWAIAAGFGAAAPFAGLPPGYAASSYAVLLAALAALFAISLVDDYRGVAPAWRMLVQAGGALGVSIALAGPSGDALAIAAVAVALVAATNFFNFMDGSDGLAATTAILGFGAYAAAAMLSGGSGAAYAALAAAAIPVLAINAPPARAFIGDVGAVPLGFLAATFGIAGWRDGAWPAWFPILVFLPFAADATSTLVRRLLAGERVWEAHRTHYYQRLHRLGAGHRGTLAVYGALAAGSSATAVAVLAVAPEAGGWALLAWVAVVAALFAGIDYHWRRRAPAS